MYSGSLVNFYRKWTEITNDSLVLQWVQGIRIPFNTKPKQLLEPKNCENIDQSPYQTAINKLLSIGAISRCSPMKNQFLSSYFLVKKPDGSNRFILNLKKLNNFIIAPHFKLEDYRTALKLITPNCYLTNIDLKDAYFLLPIANLYKKYLRFRFQGALYEFNCLPFGLNIAPFLFTKLFKPIVKILRKKGVICVVYLDDILIIGQTETECMNSTKITVNLLEQLGFMLNLKKSSLKPQQSIKFLGFVYDTLTMTISLPYEKIKNIKRCIQEFLKKKGCTIRDLARLIGRLVAACPATRYGFIHTKSLEKIKHSSLRRKHKNYNKKIIIPQSVRYELKWWQRNIGNGQSIKPENFALEIFSDASKIAWGAYCLGQKCHGFWDHSEQDMHINFLEIRAAFYALKCFAKVESNVRILLRIDNQTAISCINRGGSVKFQSLNQATVELWQWCEAKGISVFAAYIASTENVEADEQSRSVTINTEYEIDNRSFQLIVQMFGSPEIDLFATRINAKCKKYISWFPDPDCFSVDAFTIKWNQFYFYAFPPFSIITKVIEKIIQDKATGILVVPHWPSQPWYPVFKKLLIQSPLKFPPRKFLLLSPFRDIHPLHQQLSLEVGKLSGDLF